LHFLSFRQRAQDFHGDGIDFAVGHDLAQGEFQFAYCPHYPLKTQIVVGVVVTPFRGK
jgi:hypothetical protein